MLQRWTSISSWRAESCAQVNLHDNYDGYGVLRKFDSLFYCVDWAGETVINICQSMMVLWKVWKRQILFRDQKVPIKKRLEKNKFCGADEAKSVNIGDHNASHTWEWHRDCNEIHTQVITFMPVCIDCNFACRRSGQVVKEAVELIILVVRENRILSKLSQSG